MAVKGGEEEKPVNHSILIGLGLRCPRRLGNSIVHISLRRSSDNCISPSGKNPPGKFHFSFTSSPTDIHNTDADYQDNCHEYPAIYLTTT